MLSLELEAVLQQVRSLLQTATANRPTTARRRIEQAEAALPQMDGLLQQLRLSLDSIDRVVAAAALCNDN